MKQREARGAASPRREQEQKEEDRRTEWPGGRELWKGRGRTRELILRVKQILFGQRAADGERACNGRKRAARKKKKTRATFFARRFTIILLSALGGEIKRSFYRNITKH